MLRGAAVLAVVIVAALFGVPAAAATTPSTSPITVRAYDTS